VTIFAILTVMNKVRLTHTTQIPARIEDMTQPMGPLEEGDQALIDAIHRSPDANHKRVQTDGSETSVSKWEDVGGVVLKYETDYGLDGGKEEGKVNIDYFKPNGPVRPNGPAFPLSSDPIFKAGIRLDITRTPPDEDAEPTFTQIANNRVDDIDGARFNRSEVQNLKLEIAKRIDAATDAAIEARDHLRIDS
jgi:hypothetical protein